MQDQLGMIFLITDVKGDLRQLQCDVDLGSWSSVGVQSMMFLHRHISNGGKEGPGAWAAPWSSLVGIFREYSY
jgi:hypothetical protein